MFDNIGGKIKRLAEVSAVAGLAACCVCGCALALMEVVSPVIGFLICLLGLLFIPASYALYGFGELVENVVKLTAHVEKNPILMQPQLTVKPEKSVQPVVQMVQKKDVLVSDKAVESEPEEIIVDEEDVEALIAEAARRAGRTIYTSN